MAHQNKIADLDLNINRIKNVDEGVKIIKIL